MPKWTIHLLLCLPDLLAHSCSFRMADSCLYLCCCYFRCVFRCWSFKLQPFCFTSFLFPFWVCLTFSIFPIVSFHLLSSSLVLKLLRLTFCPQFFFPFTLLTVRKVTHSCDSIRHPNILTVCVYSEPFSLWTCLICLDAYFLPFSMWVSHRFPSPSSWRKLETLFPILLLSPPWLLTSSSHQKKTSLTCFPQVLYLFHSTFTHPSLQILL